VSIVVVLTADGARAQRCLRAIASGTASVPCEVLVVLNGVEPDLRLLATEQATGARVIDSAVDLGTPAAWRQALALARAPRVALLHEDSTPAVGWLEPLVATMDSRPHAALVGSRLLSPDGSHQNDGWVLWRDAHVSVLRGALAQPGSAPPRPVDYVSSASLLADREFLERFDLPDERWFPAVYTDTDMARTAWAAGRIVLHVPQSVVMHEGGAMVQPGGRPARGIRLPEFLNVRNRERFLEKWAAELTLRPHRPYDVFPDAVPPEPILAALAVTAQRAAAIEATAPPAAAATVRPPGPARVAVDAETVARAEAARRVLEQEFTGWLSARLEQALADVETLTRAREAELGEAAALRAEIERLRS
jgi:hypothetical protein